MSPYDFISTIDDETRQELGVALESIDSSDFATQRALALVAGLRPAQREDPLVQKLIEALPQAVVGDVDGAARNFFVDLAVVSRYTPLIVSNGFNATHLHIRRSPDDQRTVCGLTIVTDRRDRPRGGDLWRCTTSRGSFAAAVRARKSGDAASRGRPHACTRCLRKATQIEAASETDAFSVIEEDVRRSAAAAARAAISTMQTTSPVHRGVLVDNQAQFDQLRRSCRQLAFEPLYQLAAERAVDLGSQWIRDLLTYDQRQMLRITDPYHDESAWPLLALGDVEAMIRRAIEKRHDELIASYFEHLPYLFSSGPARFAIQNEVMATVFPRTGWGRTSA